MTVEAGVAPPVAPDPPDRRLDLDALRIIAAVMVVTIHSTQGFIVLGETTHDLGPAYWIALVANGLSRCGVPIFFAVSGWLLLRREIPDQAGWLWTRVVRLGVPLLVWSAIYIVAEWLRGEIVGVPAWNLLGRRDWLLARITQVVADDGVRTHLWYLYFAIAVAIAIWLVQGARLEHRDRRAYALAAVALILPMGLARMLDVSYGWMTLGWSLGYTALGYVLISSQPRRGLAALSFVVCGTLVVVLNGLLGNETWPGAYQSPLVLGSTIGVVWLVSGRRIPDRWRSTVMVLGALTLGVYLVHPLMLDIVRIAALPGRPLGGLSPLPRLLLQWTFALTASTALVWLWHRSRRLTQLLG